MEVDFLHVSAFTSVPGGGNPAGVCQFDAWPSDDVLTAIAREVALPVTACIACVGGRMELRWISMAGTFVQSMCGHGTLAASCVVASEHPEWDSFAFHTSGGLVPVRRDGDMFLLSLPKWPSTPVGVDPALADALGCRPTEVHDAGRDLIAIYPDEEIVRRLAPDMNKLRALGKRGFIASAQGREFDCVSRFFCPSFGIGVDEDPVTGSAHCSIAPLWAQKLGRSRLRAHQASAVGGELLCDVSPDAVTIGAPAVILKRGSINIPPGRR